MALSRRLVAWGFGALAAGLVVAACNQVAGLNDLRFEPATGGAGGVGGRGVGASGGTDGAGGMGGAGGGACDVDILDRHLWSTTLNSSADVDLKLIVPRSVEGDLVVARHADTMTLLDQTFVPRPNGHLLALMGPEGQFQGASQLSTPSENDIFSITGATSDEEGNTYLAGQLSGDLVLDGTPTGNSLGAGSYIARLSSSFGISAVNYFTASTVRIEAEDLAVTPDGIWAAGRSVGVDPEVGRLVLYSNQGSPSVLRVLNLEPNQTPSDDSSIDRVEALPDGDVLISGRTDERFAIQNIPESEAIAPNAARSLFVARVSVNDGNVTTVWSRIIGGNDVISGAAFVVNEKRIALVGHLRGNAVFSPEISLTANADTDLFLAVLDAENGETLAAYDYPSPGPDRFGSAAADGRVYVVGTFENTLDFGTKVLTAADTSPFLAELRLDGTVCFAAALENATINSTLVELGHDGELLLGGNFIGALTLGGTGLMSTGISPNVFMGALRR